MDDIIKREDAIKAMADYLDLLGVARRYAKSVINKVPSAEKHGEWIPNSPYTGLCSECGGEGNLKNNFCPNCRADMRGAANE